MILNYLIFLLLPLYLVKIKLTPQISLNILDLLIISTICLNFYQSKNTASLLLKKFSLQKIFLFLTPFLLIIFGFFFSFLFSILKNPSFAWSDNLGKLLDLIVIPIFYGLSLAITSINQPRKPLSFFSAYLISAVTISLLGIVFLIFQQTSFDHRLQIFFPSPNQLAIFLTPAFLIISLFLFSKTKNLPREPFFNHNPGRLFYFVWFILLVNLYYSKSLGAWLSILITFLFFYLLKNTSSKTALAFFRFSLLTIVFLSLFLIFAHHLPFLSKVNWQHPTSYDSRLVIYRVDSKLIFQYPFLGIGPANFQDLYLSQQKNFPPFPQWAVPHAHNFLLHFWLSGGILSLLGLLIMFYQTTISFKNNFQKIKNSFFQLLTLTIIFYFLWHGLVDTPIWTEANAILFWGALILFLSSTNLLADDQQKTKIPLPDPTTS